MIPFKITPRKLAEFEALTIPEPNSGCLIFLGDLTPKGYGRFAHGRRGRRPAHQVALDIAGRPRPPGLEPHHTCRLRCCVNEGHLEYKTHRENLLEGDTIVARAAAKTKCPKGHPLAGINLQVRKGKRSCRECDRDRHRRSYRPTTSRRRRQHLSRGERVEIKAMLRRKVSHKKIAEAVNVSTATVSHVRNGRNGYGRPASNI